MIPLKEVRICIEKDAGLTTKIFKKMVKNPKATLAVIGGTAILGGGATLLDRMAARAHPAHQMLREEGKRKIMKKQTSLLNEMLELQRKNSKQSIHSQKKIFPPLS